MTSVVDYLQLLLIVVPVIGAPGPGNLMCAAIGARHRLGDVFRFIVGLELMVFVPAFAVGLGVGVLLERAGTFLDWLQIAGSLFIIYLAVMLLRQPPAPELADAPDGGRERAPGFVDAVVLQALNAKGAVVLVVIFAEFADEGSTVANALAIAATITVVSLVFHLLWFRVGQWLARRFSSPRALRIQAWTYAVMLVTVAVWLLFG